MSISAFLQTAFADYTKYAPAIGLVATGIALITAQNYGPGVQAILQGIALIAAGSTAVSLHYAIRRVPSDVLRAMRRGDVDRTIDDLIASRKTIRKK